jgi:hypothetical protein
MEDGQVGAPMAAQPGAHMAGQPGAHMAAQPGTHMAGQPGAHMAGQREEAASRRDGLGEATHAVRRPTQPG